MAGQGSVYLKLQDWVYCLLMDGNSDDDNGKGEVLFPSVVSLCLYILGFLYVGFFICVGFLNLILTGLSLASICSHSMENYLTMDAKFLP